ncbi:RND transporter [Haloprofundus marisrubri]|uniref:RND transporter n=1 Tax=Haloprofundus marisrubri TaxID=1514971 RepID=A0A0W1R9G7_9EURY|nr:MMPL family transporter [Haloprofundus marisrubri]KTG10185.1 RND transporter [Haloprofundus marisrubri]
MALDHQRAIDWVDERIVEKSGRVAVLFLVLTLVFTAGLGNVSTEAGTEQFAEDIPANQALEDVNREFGASFESDPGSTQLIQRSQNVLSKPSLLEMLRTQEALEEKQGLRVSSTSSAATVVAGTLDPEATTLETQITAIERATPSEIRAAVRENAGNPALTGTLSNDFNRRSASASATIGVVQHDIPGYESSGSAGQGGTSPLTPIQQQAQRVVAATSDDITVFGSGVTADEFGSVITDSLLIVTPAAVVFIVFFLVVAYRDLLDLLLGMLSLLMAIIWTFGFLGLAGIPFSQMMIAVPPLLLAVGIDFGIHAINRYREDKADGNDIDGAMRLATDQLLVAFFIVTGTTVIGFLSNLVSDLAPIRDFGIVAAVGIIFTFLIFGIFLPAAKVWIDRRRDGWPIPTFSESPLGAEGSRLGEALRGGVVVAGKAPAVFLVLVVLLSAGAGAYATGVDTSFSQEDFLPPEETPAYLDVLPEPFAPSEYSVVATLNFLEDKFETTQGGSATIYWQTNMERNTALEEIHRAGDDPPNSFVQSGGRADSQSIVTVIQSQAARDPEFRAVVDRNDADGNGIPDRNLGDVYAALMDTPARSQAVDYLSDDRRSTRITYSTKATASQNAVTQDARTVAEKFRGGEDAAIATGNTVVFKAVSDLILQSAIASLLYALGATVAFLVFVYWVVEGYPSLGVANTVPIAVAVALIAGTMRLLGISFNAFTATILAITIGLGIDYSVHVVHRFVDERREYPLFTALDRTVRGTGGALAGSMLTTTFGIGVLVLSLLQVLGQFGVLTALSIAYSFFVSLLVLPSVLVLWDRYQGHDPAVPIGHGTTSPDRGDGVAADGGVVSGANDTSSRAKRSDGGFASDASKPTSQSERRDGEFVSGANDTTSQLETKQTKAHATREER